MSKRTARLTAGLLLVPALLARDARAQVVYPVADPGFPYVDANQDGAFNPADGDIGRATGVDILALVLNDGSFSPDVAEGGYVPPASPAALVIPRSVRFSSRTLPGLTLSAGRDISFFGQASLSAAGAWLTITSDRNIHMDGAVLSANGDLAVDAGTFFDETIPGDVTAAGARLSSRTGDIGVAATHRILADRVSVSAYGSVDIENDGPDDLVLTNASVRSRTGKVGVFADHHDDGAGEMFLDVGGSRVSGPAGVDVATHHHRLKGAAVRVSAGPDSDITFDSAGGLVDIPGAIVSGAGEMNFWTWIEEGDSRPEAVINTAGARINSPGIDSQGGIFYDAGGCGGGGIQPARILSRGASVRARRLADLVATSEAGASSIDVAGATLQIVASRTMPPGADLEVRVNDDYPTPRPSVINATGASVYDPILPTFFAETVLGDPTPRKPDLAFAGYISAKAISPTQLQVDWTVVNQGPSATAGPVSARFLFSADTTPDASDAVLGMEASAGGLAGYGGTFAGSKTYPLPGGLSPGVYYVLGTADPAGAVAELNEGNNEGFGYAVIRPDLSPTAVSATRTGTRAYRVTDTVKNLGPVAAPSFTVYYYLSPDDTLSTTDFYAGARTISALAPGASSTANTNVVAPASVPVGSYRVLSSADRTPSYAGAIPESNEGNNTLATAGTVPVP